MCFKYFIYTIRLLPIVTLQLCTISAVVGVDAELYKLSVECEDRIVIQSRALLPAGSRAQLQQKVDELDELSRSFGLQTRLVVMEHANSLALYFICMTLAALMSLRDQWRSRQLRDTVESLFTFLSGATRTVHVKRLIWPLTDYERCLEFFSSAQGNPAYHIFINDVVIVLVAVSLSVSVSMYVIRQLAKALT